MAKVKMIMIDKFGAYIVLDTFSIDSDSDDGYLETLEKKLAKAREKFPNARSLYFEDFRDCDDECEEFDILPCDYRGICAGPSCPRFFGCQA